MDAALTKMTALIQPPILASDMQPIIDNATAAANDVISSITSKNASKVGNALIELNTIIGTTSLDRNTYGQAYLPMELLLVAANAWLVCEGNKSK